MAIVDGIKDFFEGFARGFGLFVFERNNFTAGSTNPGLGIKTGL